MRAKRSELFIGFGLGWVRLVFVFVETLAHPEPQSSFIRTVRLDVGRGLEVERSPFSKLHELYRNRARGDNFSKKRLYSGPWGTLSTCRFRPPLRPLVISEASFCSARQTHNPRDRQAMEDPLS